MSARDLDMDDDDIHRVVVKAVELIARESNGDNAGALSAAIGAMMHISRQLGFPDHQAVEMLAEMFADNPMRLNA